MSPDLTGPGSLLQSSRHHAQSMFVQKNELVRALVDVNMSWQCFRSHQGPTLITRQEHTTLFVTLPLFNREFLLRIERCIWSLSLSLACSSMISSNDLVSCMCLHLGSKWPPVRHSSSSSLGLRIFASHIFLSSLSWGSSRGILVVFL